MSFVPRELETHVNWRSSDVADPRGWTITDAYGYGPALWVAPVLDDGAREREVTLPRGRWIETWSGERVAGGGDAQHFRFGIDTDDLASGILDG